MASAQGYTAEGVEVIAVMTMMMPTAWVWLLVSAAFVALTGCTSPQS